MTTDVITADPASNMKQAYDIMQQHKIGKLPLLEKKSKLVGLYSYADVRRLVEMMRSRFSTATKNTACA